MHLWSPCNMNMSVFVLLLARIRTIYNRMYIVHIVVVHIVHWTINCANYALIWIWNAFAGWCLNPDVHFTKMSNCSEKNHVSLQMLPHFYGRLMKYACQMHSHHSWNLFFVILFRFSFWFPFVALNSFIHWWTKYKQKNQ